METSVDEVLRQEYNQSVQDIDDINLSDLCESSEEENEIDQLKDSKKRVENSLKLFIQFLKIKIIIIELQRPYFLI